jgi:hypothetical protein
MADEQTLSAADVRDLARAAGLDLDDARAAAIAPTLGSWLTAAQQLNRLMSEPERRDVTPIAIFQHPPVAPEEQP